MANIRTMLKELKKQKINKNILKSIKKSTCDRDILFILFDNNLARCIVRNFKPSQVYDAFDQWCSNNYTKVLVRFSAEDATIKKVIEEAIAIAKSPSVNSTVVLTLLPYFKASQVTHSYYQELEAVHQQHISLINSLDHEQKLFAEELNRERERLEGELAYYQEEIDRLKKLSDQ